MMRSGRFTVPAVVVHFTGLDAASVLRAIADWFAETGAACVAVINTGDDAGTWQVVADMASAPESPATGDPS